ncbi:MAG: aldo/keto reductase [Actinomycetota bacterium]|nr:aldo/keto reductase [Actinomycetota bacterium]
MTAAEDGWRGPEHELSDGTTIPAIGFGTYPLKGPEGVDAIRSAIELGYRLIDTAVNYGNETEVGEAIRLSGIPRERIMVTTKIPGRHHGYDDAVRSAHESLGRLGLEQIDLLLIHWPNPSQNQYPQAWRALVDLQQQGLARSIGVSNFTEAHLQRIIGETGVSPVVNQIELHPNFPQEEMREVNQRLGIRTESWSPMGKRQAPYDEKVIRAAADAHQIEPGQVILRWHVQLGAVPIPKSANRERQQQNLDVFGFELTPEEMDSITALGRPDGRLFGGDPESHEEP